MLFNIIFLSTVFSLQDCPDDQFNYKGLCVPLQCKTRIQYLSAEKKSSGQKFVPIEFNGSVSIDPLEIKINFIDEFNGLFYRDNHESCVTHQLYKHKMNYLEPIPVSSNISSSLQNQERQWKFTIEDLSQLYKDEQKDKDIYNGYYSIDYLIGEYRQLTYLFNFQVILNKDSNLIEQHYEGNIIDDEAACNLQGRCLSFSHSEIMFCKNKTCEQQSEVATFVQGEAIYVQQSIKEIGFEDWYAYDAEVSIMSNNLVKKLKPIGWRYQNQSTIYQLDIGFIADLSSIAISSKLSSKAYMRNLQTQTSNALVVGYSDNIYCIKKTNQSECPSEIEISEFNQPDCGTVDLLYCLSAQYLVGMIAFYVFY